MEYEMILTNGEIYTSYIEAANQTLRPQDERIALAFARAIEAAVLTKLSQGVEMPEPVSYVSFNKQGDISRVIKRKDSWTNTPVFTADQLHTAIAAARVQALEDAAVVAEYENAADWSVSGQIARQIRALKGGAA